MPVRIATNFSPIVRRNGKNVRVAPGAPFDFTADEIAEFTAHHPHGMRRAVNEAAEVTSLVGDRPYVPSPDPVPTEVAPDPEYHLNEEVDDELDELDTPPAKMTKPVKAPLRTARGR